MLNVNIQVKHIFHFVSQHCLPLGLLNFNTYYMVQYGRVFLSINIFIFLKGSLIMRNFNFGVGMRLGFSHARFNEYSRFFLQNATVTTGRETPLLIA
jgi:hypothetical protein